MGTSVSATSVDMHDGAGGDDPELAEEAPDDAAT